MAGTRKQRDRTSQGRLTLGRWRGIRYLFEQTVRQGRAMVFRTTRGVLGIVTLATIISPSWSEEDFPLVGTYTENQPCKGDGSDANVARVKISRTEIDSAFGLCTILDIKRDGNVFAVQVECKGPGGAPMLGDVKFTLLDDKTVDFVDQDQTYKAVLHRCPQ